jgi:hypothetical protein
LNYYNCCWIGEVSNKVKILLTPSIIPIGVSDFVILELPELPDVPVVDVPSNPSLPLVLMYLQFLEARCTS